MRDDHPLLRLMRQSKLRVVGLMSGTSLDGIDAVMVELDTLADRLAPRVLGFVTRPYTILERQYVESLFTADAKAICQGSFWLAERFAAAVQDVEAQAGVKAELIGSHGQTIWHQPPSACSAGETPSTLQIGEPALIAARTGVVTVGDFRVADVALGGEGAPLVPLTDWLVYREPKKSIALQNIGGIANVTFVTEEAADLVAFDNGPGNMMIDAAIEWATDGAERFDRDGTFSARGTVQDDLLSALLADPYLAKTPPKSTGREYYGRKRTLAWLAEHRDRQPLDLVATLVAFTAAAIADSYRRFLQPRGTIAAVRLSGGGAHNHTLIARLREQLGPTLVEPIGDATHIDAKEAIAFAILAVQTLHARPGNLPHVTNASRPVPLGKICLPRVIGA